MSLRATGIVRRIDDLGRVVIPKNVREIAGLQIFDPMEIYVGHDGEVILKKYSPYDDTENSYKEE